jgi:hypothetical protein
MKISEITGRASDTRIVLEFDVDQRDSYVARFLAVFHADLSEEEMCRQAYEIHCEVRHQHGLYIAIADRLGSKIKAALHWYSQCRGQFKPKPKFKVEE